MLGSAAGRRRSHFAGVLLYGPMTHAVEVLLNSADVANDGGVEREMLLLHICCTALELLLTLLRRLSKP